MKPEKLFKEINDLHAANVCHAQHTAENAVVIGVKFHQLKEILPHGEFEAKAFTKTHVSDQTRTRYMAIARERLIEQRALKLLPEANSPDGQKFHVALFNDPDQQHIPADIRDQARAEIDAEDFKWTALDIKPKDLARGLESTDLMDLYRQYGVIRPRKPAQHHDRNPDPKAEIDQVEPDSTLLEHVRNDLMLLLDQQTTDYEDAETKLLREFQTILQASSKRVSEVLKARKANR